MTQKKLLQQVRKLSDRMVELQAPIRVLDAVNWDKETRQRFFQDKGQRLPDITLESYQKRDLGFDPQALRYAFSALEQEISRTIGQLNPMARLMRRMCTEYRQVLRMVESRGTPDFHHYSVELYGHPHDVFHAGDPTLAQLAIMLEEPLVQLTDHEVFPEESKDISAEEAVSYLDRVLSQSMPGLNARVILSDGIVSDAAAGSDYIKLNKDVMFSQRELDLLEAHEGWIHVGTTQNGLAQPYLTCLAKGTPSSTVTQEGLAVLTEIITLRSTPKRLSKLVNRIRAVTLASDGADFIEVYRYLLDKGLNEDDSYTIASRTFRGSLPDGLPFTKDLAYIKGFVLTYNFFRVAVQKGRIDLLQLLLVGKIQLEDFRLISELYEQGIVTGPKFLPPHFQDMRGLVTWLSFGRFIGSLKFDQLEKDYSPLF
ncbi:flavohemoglobin expression-modulating QEGLA motif protein [Oceanospirillum maris]|uniref:flavohemoglobin expression-modulating QEGLA motif protein n=1 Tax=Oceanospirillum maris TaxID=64977 RepID=UPI0004242875|nr:flavohemoglobin expression-modulating QEGLA motif protein [Oceanospirillum maris]